MMKLVLAFVLPGIISYAQAGCDLNEVKACIEPQLNAFVDDFANYTRSEHCEVWNSLLESDCNKNCPEVNLRDVIAQTDTVSKMILFRTFLMIFSNFFRGFGLHGRTSIAPRIMMHWIVVTNLN